MSKKILIRHFKISIAFFYYLLVVFPMIVSAAQVTLQWDAGNPAPEGYCVYQRVSGQDYDYSQAVWAGTATACTVANLSEDVTYYYIVRAFNAETSSGDSNEVSFISTTNPPAGEDSDGDGIEDALDAFPADPNEWLDTDNDGIGNNADADDDGDGMTDSWEALYGLNPLENDAGLDLDGDGFSNLEEFLDGTDPSSNPDNQTPDTPIVSTPTHGATTSTNPVVSVGNYLDRDGDVHLRTQYQISLDIDFTQIVFDRTSTIYLTNLTIPDLILDPDSTYYLRARFFDARNGASQWSEIRTFYTSDFSSNGDSNADGVLDDQELGAYADLDSNGINDQLQEDILTLNAPDNVNPQIAVKTQNNYAQVIAARGYQSSGLGLASSVPATMTGLVCFKLYLENGVDATSVAIHLTTPAPENGTWYKYDIEAGWYPYPNAIFSADRKTITLLLEDGGMGDQDGVRNGVIVDPAGLAYTSSQSGGSTASTNETTSNGGCFIGVSQGEQLDDPISIPVMFVSLICAVLLGCLAFRKLV